MTDYESDLEYTRLCKWDSCVDLSISFPEIVDGKPATAIRHIRTSHPVSQRAARLTMKKRMRCKIV
jgi:hypothetical protein